MSRKVVVDTSVILLIATPVKKDARHRETTLKRRNHAANAIRYLNQQRFELWIPAVALSELVAPNGESIARAVMKQGGALRVAAFDQPISRIAATMQAAAFGAKPIPEGRVAMKFDTLIAATAHAKEATYLLAAEKRGFDRHLLAVGSATKVFRADEPNTMVPQLALELPDAEAEEADDEADEE